MLPIENPVANNSENSSLPNENEQETTSQERVSLQCSVLNVVNYVLQQNRIPVIQSLCIHNPTDTALENLELTIAASPDFALPIQKLIDYVPAQTNYEVKDIRLALNGEFLAGLTEKLTGILTFTLEQEDTILCTENVEITTLAFDQWHGSSFFPELLTAFITPNHPDVVRTIRQAAALLGQWTGDPSLDGYLSNDHSRVLLQAAAIYCALQNQQIVYALHPASFERVGQRIRLCDAVLEQKLGTCMDLTLLYASCLEAIGLHPILVLKPEHIFTGFWLDKLTFPEPVQDDASALTKRLANGVNEIAVVETTCLVAGKNVSFDEARQAAEQSLIGEHPIDYLLDVTRARLSGVSPLPNRVRTETGWHIEPEKEHTNTSEAPTQFGEVIHISENQTEEFSKKIQWERKLLDLGLRNTLINMRLSRSVLPILTPTLDLLEDALVEGREFAILPRPLDWQPSEGKDLFDQLHDLSANTELLKHEFENSRLRTIHTDKELEQALKHLYRTAKTSLEENGANTLYLALGLLRWYEGERSQKARYAPLILIPVDVVRKVSTHSYHIRLRDDEPQMNITVLEMLKQEFGIVVNGLDPLPGDGTGVDIRKVLTTVRKAVMGKNRWDVLESAYLGIFSFSQFVLWNDIHNRSEELSRNKIVRSLMDGKLAWNAEDMQLGKRVNEDSVYLPLPADASQLFAIEAAANGQSFVLHGPPGTGKSQTITALIANALAQGKTVLFVAEKMAALEVVEKRLEAIGLGDFCLELHSNKAKKRAVLEQLRLATEVTRDQTPEAYEMKANQLSLLRKELDSYEEALHRPTGSGMSLFDLINEYEACQDAPDLPLFDDGFLAGITPEALDRHQTALERLVAAGREVGHPHGHVLSPITGVIYTQHMRLTLPQQIADYQKALEDFQDANDAFVAKMPFANDGHTTLHALEVRCSIAAELEKWLVAPRAWAKAESPNRYLLDVRAMAAHFRKATELRRVLLTQWTPDFLKENGRQLRMEYNQNNSKWFLGKLIGMGELTRRLSGYAKTQLMPDRLGTELERLTAYQEEAEAAKELFARYGDGLGQLYLGEATQWEQIDALAAALQQSAMHLSALAQTEEVRQQYAGDQRYAPLLRNLIESRKKLVSVQDQLFADLGISPYEGEQWLAHQSELCQLLLTHRNELRNWIYFNQAARDVADCGIPQLVAAYRHGMAHEDLWPAYRKALCQSLASTHIDNDPALYDFSGAVFNEKIKQLKRMDQELMSLTRQEIFCRLAARVPSFTKEAAQSSELGILQRAIRSNGRGMSIRKLFQQIPNLLPRLCPCMLMSPISAAQYLEPSREPFDLVVFDEASQLPTCKAVGALARGKDAVIVGDPNQMPPTSFFMSATMDEEHLDVEDLESILDDCLALNMPQTHLLWHYRSRHESLIAFSNNQFYQNKLFTFPSVNDRESKVRLVHVDGVFERGKHRQNRAEAEAVVEELIKRCHDEKLRKHSVGVVTFNIMQQNLIDDLLLEACKTDPELEQWAYEGEEPVFVKNLENVQGDERDVILFSIGYGPDEKGKVYMNFGPLNREGGWRRLNVAVSRARQEMIVFSTLRPDQIDLNKTSAQGVAALKAFLEYAGGQELSADENTVQQSRQQPQGIATAICKALSQHGYRTQTDVGHSEYRIDVGVIDPVNEEQYLLGILLDGQTYGASKTTRDREIAQIAVLNDLGWRIHRVWSMDWWENSAYELEKILSLLDKIRNGEEPDQSCDIASETIEASEPVQDSESCSLDDRHTVAQSVSDGNLKKARHYFAAPLEQETLSSEDFLLSKYDASIIEKLNQILNFEAPICEALLCRRLVQSYGMTRSGSRLQQKIRKLLTRMDVKTTLQDDALFYWATTQNPDDYAEYRVNGGDDNRRDAREIPVQEAANAVCYVLEEQFSLPTEALIREAAKCMGYARVAANITAVFQAAIDHAAACGRITQNAGDNWMLCEEPMEN